MRKIISRESGEVESRFATNCLFLHLHFHLFPKLRAATWHFLHVRVLNLSYFTCILNPVLFRHATVICLIISSYLISIENMN